MLFNLFVKEAAIQWERPESVYSILVIEAESIEAAAESLAVEIRAPDDRGCAAIICPEALYRLQLNDGGGEMWLAPIIRDQPGTLSEALDRMGGERSLVLPREEWLAELQLQTECAVEEAELEANLARTSKAEFAQIWLDQVGECGTPEMLKSFIYVFQ